MEVWSSPGAHWLMAASSRGSLRPLQRHPQVPHGCALPAWCSPGTQEPAGQWICLGTNTLWDFCGGHVHAHTRMCTPARTPARTSARTSARTRAHPRAHGELVSENLLSPCQGPVLGGRHSTSGSGSHQPWPLPARVESITLD